MSSEMHIITLPRVQYINDFPEEILTKILGEVVDVSESSLSPSWLKKLVVEPGTFDTSSSDDEGLQVAVAEDLRPKLPKIWQLALEAGSSETAKGLHSIANVCKEWRYQIISFLLMRKARIGIDQILAATPLLLDSNGVFLKNILPGDTAETLEARKDKFRTQVFGIRNFVINLKHELEQDSLVLSSRFHNLETVHVTGLDNFVLRDRETVLGIYASDDGKQSIKTQWRTIVGRAPVGTPASEVEEKGFRYRQLQKILLAVEMYNVHVPVVAVQKVICIAKNPFEARKKHSETPREWVAETNLFTKEITLTGGLMREYLTINRLHIS